MGQTNHFGALPIKECGTPDARYGFKVTAGGLAVFFNVALPTPLIFTKKEEQAFFDEMHAAMLPVVERLYERNWKEHFAGTRDREGRLYPDEYQQLFEKPAPSQEPGR